MQTVELAVDPVMSINITNFLSFKEQHEVNLSTILTTHKQTDEKPNKSQSKGKRRNVKCHSKGSTRLMRYYWRSEINI